jgi:flagellar motor switch protein FliG
MAESKSPEHKTPPLGNAARGFAAYQQTVSQPGPKPQSPGTPRTYDAAALLKSREGAKLLAPRFKKTAEPEAETGEGTKESKYRRVAKLLILIGPEEAAPILSHLEPAQVEAISKEIAAVRGVTPEEAASILVEFRSLLSAQATYSAAASGGAGTARELLYAAFGKEKGEALMRKTLPDAAENQFDFLEELNPEQLLVLFKDETPAAEALVLSRLSPKTAAAVLNNSPPPRKIEVVRRIARLDKTSPDVLDRVAKALKTKAEQVKNAAGTGSPAEIDGLQILTGILKSSDPSFGDRILQELGAGDPYLQADLKERLNTLDDVVKAEDRAIQDKLFSMPDVDVVLLLKNQSPDFTEKILSNMSVERRVHIREEAEILGPQRKRDVDRVTKQFLDWFRENREAGHILLIDDKDIIV